MLFQLWFCVFLVVYWLLIIVIGLVGTFYILLPTHAVVPIPFAFSFACRYAHVHGSRPTGFLRSRLFAFYILFHCYVVALQFLPIPLYSLLFHYWYLIVLLPAYVCLVDSFTHLIGLHFTTHPYRLVWLHIFPVNVVTFLPVCCWFCYVTLRTHYALVDFFVTLLFSFTVWITVPTGWFTLLVGFPVSYLRCCYHIPPLFIYIYFVTFVFYYYCIIIVIGFPHSLRWIWRSCWFVDLLLPWPCVLLCIIVCIYICIYHGCCYFTLVDTSWLLRCLHWLCFPRILHTFRSQLILFTFNVPSSAFPLLLRCYVCFVTLRHFTRFAIYIVRYIGCCWFV